MEEPILEFIDIQAEKLLLIEQLLWKKFLSRLSPIPNYIHCTGRKCVIHERIVLYYKIVDEEVIDLLTFWNTYQDPNNLKV